MKKSELMAKVNGGFLVRMATYFMGVSWKNLITNKFDLVSYKIPDYEIYKDIPKNAKIVGIFSKIEDTCIIVYLQTDMPIKHVTNTIKTTHSEDTGIGKSIYFAKSFKLFNKKSKAYLVEVRLEIKTLTKDSLTEKVFVQKGEDNKYYAISSIPIFENIVGIAATPEKAVQRLDARCIIKAAKLKKTNNTSIRRRTIKKIILL